EGEVCHAWETDITHEARDAGHEATVLFAADALPDDALGGRVRTLVDPDHAPNHRRWGGLRPMCSRPSCARQHCEGPPLLRWAYAGRLDALRRPPLALSI